MVEEPTQVNPTSTGQAGPSEPAQVEDRAGVPYKLGLQEFFNHPDRQAGEAFLKRWYFWATRSRLQPVIEAAKAME